MMAHRDTQGKTLLDRRAEQTRADIFEAAIPLFLEHGFDEVSMEDVAAAAGMSRRTVYRYFATKDDIVFESPRQWLRVFNVVVADRREDETTRDLFRRALVAVGDFVQHDAANVLAGFSILTSSPSLAARHGRSDREWIERYLELLLPELASEPAGVLQATTIATALIGAQNGLMMVWAGQYEHGADAGEMMGRMLDQLDSMWPPVCR